MPKRQTRARTKTKTIQRGYGYVRDVTDPRDFAYQSVRPAQAPLPPSIDLRHLCSPVRDQGQLGSCTGFAIAVGLREFLENKTSGKFVKMSPLFVYYEERSLEHSINQDAGAQPRDGMKVLAKIGCAPEKDDPYNVAKFEKSPSTKAVTDAARFKIAAYHRLASLDEIQQCLAGGNGAVLGFQVYESFESNAVAKTGNMPMPQPNEKVVGGHAVFAAGYKMDAKWPGGGYLIVKNSWSTAWGDQGYFYMPFAYVTPQLVSDAWTAVL
jgi:C1A family cysteine protease